MALLGDGELRTYRLTTTAELRDHKPPDQQVTFSEVPGHATVRTGDVLFDGLYALAVSEARANSVSRISDPSYARGQPIRIDAFETGELWQYVWTRDLAYALHLGLAGFDPPRAVSSLLFKASGRKPALGGGVDEQIVQDTGSGGSYPVSTDRVVWALGAHETLKHLSGAERRDFLEKVYPILCGTIEQDRRLVFDPRDGLYRGEQSFLDWREQSYPGWTKANVLAIATSKALSVNAANHFLLTRAAGYAGLLGEAAAQGRYTRWAGELREAINHRFWDAEAGLYSTYLLSDDGGGSGVRVARYDLLGECLAILCGVADERQAASILASYPTGPAGPPVVWPQERTVPIYHNQGIWPFVTAYWIKAARQVGNPAVVDAGIASLEQQAALNLSNMENFDFVSGRAQVKNGPRVGPPVNSRRQLWSVAGYLSMVQDVVFGLETSWEGIRFRPFVTARLGREIFGETEVIEWRGFVYQGTRHLVRVHLPPVAAFAQGVNTVERVVLNGKHIGPGFVASCDLRPANEWNIYLRPPDPAKPDPPPLATVDVEDERALCGPVQPRWSEGGPVVVSLEEDRLALHFEYNDPANTTVNVYRDGRLHASGVRQARWIDPDSGDYRDRVRPYQVAAVDVRSGNVSHLTPARCYRTPGQARVIPAASLRNTGGTLVAGHHFESWGQPGDELTALPLTVGRRGHYLVQAEFSNGAGPVNTGITCAVKKLEIREAVSGEIVAGGYLVMPQSGDWQRFDLSSAVGADLDAGMEYVLRVAEDEYCRNMSCLESNARYTAAAGGGERSYNFVNIAALHLLFETAK